MSHGDLSGRNAESALNNSVEEAEEEGKLEKSPSRRQSIGVQFPGEDASKDLDGTTDANAPQSYAQDDATKDSVEQTKSDSKRRWKIFSQECDL